jgi:hypothetical protein
MCESFLHIEATQAREDEAMLKAMLIRAERDFDYRPEGAGIDFDKIKRHVSARASKLVKTSESFITPELEVIFCKIDAVQRC